MVKLSLIFVLTVFSACQKEKPGNLGVKNGVFGECSSSACFSSTSEKQENKIDPIKYSGTKLQAMSEIKKYAMMLGDAKVETENDEYVHLVYSGMLNTDDLEIYINEEKKVIEFKTAARSSMDFGSNKKRAHDLPFKYIQKGM